jgi:hypothetical protein
MQECLMRFSFYKGQVMNPVARRLVVAAALLLTKVLNPESVPAPEQPA